MNDCMWPKINMCGEAEEGYKECKCEDYMSIDKHKELYEKILEKKEMARCENE